MCGLAGRADEAVAHARRALEFNPKNPGAFNNLGIALYERREYQEVLGCYERAIVLTSEFAPCAQQSWQRFARLAALTRR
jgi:tetratricopeptide (TPR) repeat protein